MASHPCSRGEGKMCEAASLHAGGELGMMPLQCMPSMPYPLCSSLKMRDFWWGRDVFFNHGKNKLVFYPKLMHKVMKTSFEKSLGEKVAMLPMVCFPLFPYMCSETADRGKRGWPKGILLWCWFQSVGKIWNYLMGCGMGWKVGGQGGSVRTLPSSRNVMLWGSWVGLILPKIPHIHGSGFIGFYDLLCHKILNGKFQK